MRDLGYLLENLNDFQKQAVLHEDGPLVVFAGAGSGKTRIITTRIAYLIEKGVRPWEILALTFTNKAAGEMKERVNALTERGSRSLVATFHSACAKWLREFAPELGFTSDFTIYDEKDSLSALKTLLKEYQGPVDEDTTPAEFRAAISKVKTMALLPNDELLQREFSGLMPRGGQQIYQRYQEYLAASNAMDFGDLILNVLLLLRRNKNVARILQERYRYILVDEYQDTNKTQFELIARLGEKTRNIFVVGDDDQSIYSWRGALPSNIIDFDSIYPEAVNVTLAENYRCTANIVEAASAMITHNQKRVDKELFSNKERGDLINYRIETDGEMEAWWVVDSVTSELSRFPLKDIAVFYRTNAQSRLLEEALRREDVAYKIFGTVRFYDRLEVKDLMAFLRLVVNEDDEVSLRRVINIPTRGIGDKAVQKLAIEAQKRKLSMMKTAKLLVNEQVPRLSVKLKVFVDIVETIRKRISESDLEDVLDILFEETNYLEHLNKKHSDQVADKTENIYEFGAAVTEYAKRNEEASLSDWLQSVTLSSTEEEIENGLSLMTLHMAKGLEFPRVYIVGVEDGLLPHRSNMDDTSLLEEERRLFYVGMTRAKEKLSFSSVYRRRTYDGWHANEPSRFLEEIPPKFYENSGEVEKAFMDPVAASYSDMNDSEHSYDYSEAEDVQTIEIGMGVRHPTYGRGIVENYEEAYGVINVTVRFSEFGLRKVKSHHLSSL